MKYPEFNSLLNVAHIIKSIEKVKNKTESKNQYLFFNLCKQSFSRNNKDSSIEERDN